MRSIGPPPLDVSLGPTTTRLAKCRKALLSLTGLFCGKWSHDKDRQLWIDVCIPVKLSMVDGVDPIHWTHEALARRLLLGAEFELQSRISKLLPAGGVETAASVTTAVPQQAIEGKREKRRKEKAA